MRDLFKKQIHIPGGQKIETALNRLTIGERAIFYIFAAILIGSSLMLFSYANDAISVSVPVKGGSLSEGIIGSPRFINPILAISDADRDLSALLFSGLLRPSPDGSLIPDLAESYLISDDGLTYTVILKKELYFHDESPITSDDIIFPVSKAQDPEIKSPRRAEWGGVTTEKIDDQTIKFHLPRPYYPFIENLTLGIIPKNLWKDVSNEEFAYSLKNITPIGSGPFKIEDVKKSNEGIPTLYKLSSFEKYAGGAPFIENIYVKLYSSENEIIDAWKMGEIDSLGGISPSKTADILKNGGAMIHLNLPRIYGIFLNQNQFQIFTEKAVRNALSTAIDKNAIVQNILLGYGTALYGPLPPDHLGMGVGSSSLSTSSPNLIDQAKKILEKAGWKINESSGIWEKTEKVKNQTTTKTLAFSLAAPNVPELKEAAKMVADAWKNLGVSVDLKFFELSDLSQNVIRPRKYDALLFGQVTGRNPDLFAFWHSSQRNDPGYNIALYANSKVDKLLNEARQVKNQKDQQKIVDSIYNEIKNDIPAIFLYTPDYLYVLPENLSGFSAESIASPTERFTDITNWYLQSEKIWEIFTPQN